MCGRKFFWLCATNVFNIHTSDSDLIDIQTDIIHKETHFEFCTESIFLKKKVSVLNAATVIFFYTHQIGHKFKLM